MAQSFWNEPRNCRARGLFDGFKSVMLLFKWRSSLYKLCYKELIFLLIPYFSLSIVYRKALDEDSKRLFEQFVRYFNQYLYMISLPFILGFYVATVAARWWQQYMALPWPDRLILSIAAYVHGCDAESRKLKKTLVRHCNLMGMLLIRSMSNTDNHKKKTLEEAVKLGFMTKKEMSCYESIETDENLYWLPGLWFAQNLQAAFIQGCIKDSYAVNHIMEELLDFRGKCGTLWTYGWIRIPLIYTQVVTFAVYSFFFACIMGYQRIVDPTSLLEDGITADLYMGFSLILNFFFYMGLLKLAEQMMCPYGDGDEHFDVDFLLYRHAKVIQLGTDILSDQCPSAFPELLNQKINTNLQRKQSATKQKKKTCIIQPNDPHNLRCHTFRRMISALNSLHRPTRVAPEKNYADKSFASESDALD